MSVKNQIIDSATIQFSKIGYNNATMDDIAKEAGVAKGSLYYHFKSKDELFISLIELGIDDIISKLNSITDENISTKEMTSKVIDFIIKYYMEYPELCSLFFNEKTNGISENVIIRMKNCSNRLNKTLADLLNEAYGHNIVRKMDFELASVAIFHMLNGICMKMIEDDRIKESDAKELMIELLFNGILF